MDPDKDNANPTILNASDLPSRRREAPVRRRDDGGTGLFDDLIPPYNYLNDPFHHAVSPSDSDGDSDDALEHIDEQEVYGESRTCGHGSHCSPPQPHLHAIHCFEASRANLFALHG